MVGANRTEKSLVWKGADLIARMREIQIAAIDSTIAEAVVHAKRNHTWKNQTTDLDRSIQVIRWALRVGNTTTGVWGSTDVGYALIHELGGTIVPKRAKFLTVPVTDSARRAGSPRNMSGLRYAKSKGGQPVLVDKAGRLQYLLRKSVTIPARPYLRPAADAVYPNLVKHMKRLWTTLPKGGRPSAYSRAADGSFLGG